MTWRWWVWSREGGIEWERTELDLEMSDHIMTGRAIS